MKLKELRVSGYKNLKDCVLPMRDFNVIVGPNNSGKSNLLEVFHCLWCLCFGGEEERRGFLMGAPIRRREQGDVIFWHRQDGPISIGVTFETEVNGEYWTVEFDASASQATPPHDHKGVGFVTEVLKAKQPSKTGPAKTYILRDARTLKVGDKQHPIPIMTSALSAIGVLYAEPESTPPELGVFLKDIQAIARTSVYAFSPESLRSNLRKEAPLSDYRVSSTNLLVALDEIFQDKKKASLFRNTLCDILDLEDVDFKGFDASLPSGTGKQQEKRSQRVRFCFLKKRAGGAAELSEYSDGTLIVSAIIATMVLHDRTQGLTCIEELENCLHPSAQEKLLRFLREHSPQWQLIMTTHSPYLVNGVSPDDVLVAVVGEQGFTRFVKPGKKKDIDELLKKGYMSFGDLMVSNFAETIAVPK